MQNKIPTINSLWPSTPRNFTLERSGSTNPASPPSSCADCVDCVAWAAWSAWAAGAVGLAVPAAARAADARRSGLAGAAVAAWLGSAANAARATATMAIANLLKVLIRFLSGRFRTLFWDSRGPIETLRLRPRLGDSPPWDLLHPPLGPAAESTHTNLARLRRCRRPARSPLGVVVRISKIAG